MGKKWISFLVLFAFLHYSVAGCTKRTTVQQEKLNEATMECVTCDYEVVLTTGEKFKFSKPDVRYNVVPHIITGTLNDGRKFFLNLADEDIKEIRISIGQTISRVDLVNDPDQRIYEIMVGENIYTFDKNGGRLKNEVKTIHGITNSGDEIDVPIEDILHVKVTQLDPKKVGIIGLSSILIIVAWIAAGMLAISIWGY